MARSVEPTILYEAITGKPQSFVHDIDVKESLMSGNYVRKDPNAELVMKEEPAEVVEETVKEEPVAIKTEVKEVEIKPISKSKLSKKEDSSKKISSASNTSKSSSRIAKK